MSQTLSFLIGAGFSAPFNIPTMKPFLTSFTEFECRKYPALQATLQQHLSKLATDSDIEGLLYSLSTAEDLPSALPEQSLICEKLRTWASDSRSIKSHLVSYIIERCEQFDRDLSESVVAPLLNHLDSCQEISCVHFFTTNYDRVLEHVSECNDIELDDGFEASSTDSVAPRKQSFTGKFRIYKLHGSITHYVDEEAPNSKHYFRLDRGYPLPGPDFWLSREGRKIKPLMVLPTQEKDAYVDPYGHLAHIFTETLAQGGLLIAIGTSLRDSHLVSALKYMSSKVVVLVIDTDPNSAISQIPDARCISIKADTLDFLMNLVEPLVELAKRCSTIRDISELEQEVSDFAVKAKNILRELSALTHEQQTQIKLIRTTQNLAEKLKAIRALHNVVHDGVVETISQLLDEDHPLEIRKAAVGCLGLSGNALAVSILKEIGVQDSSPEVRLETYLALHEFASPEAHEALECARKSWPEDKYFQLYRT